MHFKYSRIKMVISVTMLFGVGMPLLFPITALFLMVMYQQEKFKIYYVNKMPPNYDSTLNEIVLPSLKVPVLF
jgi:hypothetical protein